MSDEETARKAIDWFLADSKRKVQDQIAAYIQRGRRFEKTPPEDLKAIFINSFREWYASGGQGDLPETMSDAEDELTLRGEPLPHKEVKAERDALIQKLKDALELAKANPEQFGLRLTEVVNSLKKRKADN